MFTFQYPKEHSSGFHASGAKSTRYRLVDRFQYLEGHSSGFHAMDCSRHYAEKRRLHVSVPRRAFLWFSQERARELHGDQAPGVSVPRRAFFWFPLEIITGGIVIAALVWCLFQYPEGHSSGFHLNSPMAPAGCCETGFYPEGHSSGFHKPSPATSTLACRHRPGFSTPKGIPLVSTCITGPLRPSTSTASHFSTPKGIPLVSTIGIDWRPYKWQRPELQHPKGHSSGLHNKLRGSLLDIIAVFQYPEEHSSSYHILTDDRAL